MLLCLLRLEVHLDLKAYVFGGKRHTRAYQFTFEVEEALDFHALHLYASLTPPQSCY